MTRKDIALTTGGVIASLALTYLLWKRSQGKSTASVADSTEAQLASYSSAAIQSSPPSLPSGFGDSQTATTPTTPTQPTSTTSVKSDDYTAGNINDLLNSIVTDFLPTITAPHGQPAASQLIQPLKSSTANALASIPTTADDALKNISVQGCNITPGSLPTDFSTHNPLHLFTGQ